MASRRGDTFDKRQRERRRQEKAAVKRARRQGKESPNAPGVVATERRSAPPPRTQTDNPLSGIVPSNSEESDLLEMFRILSEHHNAGGIDDATFEARRSEIFEKLGIETD